MIKKLFIVLLSLLIVSCSKPSPVYHDSLGRVIQAAEFQHKWIIINYWAGWCESCIKEIPELNKFFLNNQAGNIVLYGVSYDALTLSQLQDMRKKLHIQYPVFLENPRGFWNLETIDVIPTTFIINPQGQVVKKLIGPITEASLLETLHALLQNG